MTTSPLDRLGGMRFTKLCGSGNDFVGIDGRDTMAPSRAEIAALCDRRFGIGADGLVRIAPGTAADRVRLEYWNGDGSDAALCGNGSLCAAVLSRALGIATGDSFVLETGAGAIEARVLSESRARIGVGVVDAPRSLAAIEPRPDEEAIDFCLVGVPHLIVFVTDPAKIDVARRGRELRNHPALGPAGANVNFVSHAAREGAFDLRTYERGVEGETLACGTGATATALSLLRSGRDRGTVRLRPTGGTILAVTGTFEGDRFRDVTLEGEGRIVFRGEVSPPERRIDR